MSSSQDLDAVASVRGTPAAFRYGLALAMVAAATLIAVVFDQMVKTPNLSMIFVLPVVIAAVTFGWGPALVAAGAGVLAFNFFLIAPLYSLRVNDPANVWALVLLSVTAAIVSAVAAQSRRRAVQAQAAVNQSSALQALARSLVAAADRNAIAAAVADAMARLFSAPAVVLAGEGADLAVVAQARGGALSTADEEAARWALASRMPTRGGAYPVEAAVYDFWPVLTQKRQQAVLGLRISGGETGRPENPERLVEMVGGYLAVALDREAYAAEVMEGRVEVAGERLKADLLAAVSHDLKTPLSTVLFTLQSLQTFADTHDAKTRADLLKLAETETARLSAMVANLLDMNRLEAGAVAVHPAPAAPADLAVEALRRAEAALAGHKVVNEIEAPGEPLMVDASLFVTALANVLQNAGKYAPGGSAIRLRNGGDGTSGWIEVLDEGPGFGEAIEPLFEKFSRGVTGDGRPPGTGLGLAIARGFLEAQGGRVEAQNQVGGGGALVRLTAPRADLRAPA